MASLTIKPNKNHPRIAKPSRGDFDHQFQRASEKGLKEYRECHLKLSQV